MPFVRQAELDRLERDLTSALQRAETAESRLAAERERLDGLLASERQQHNWLTLQLTSRVVTKHGGYGLDHEPPKVVDVVPNPKGYVREPNEIDMAKLDYYKRCAREMGKPEEDAVEKWEAEMRGESLTYSEDVS